MSELALPAAYEGRAAEAARRALDIAIALVVLVLSLPLLLVVALAVRLDTRGPALFRQTRIGRGGRPFTLVKFRGMHVDARERWPELYDYSYAPEELAELRFHPQHDPRVTRVGRVIRRTSVDELLNFWNVLRGEMSVVGPRPEIPELLPYYGEHAATVLTVKPGVTSLAKVSGRDGLTFLQTLAIDVEYVRTRSLGADLQIMARTVGTVLLQHGVRAG